MPRYLSKDGGKLKLKAAAAEIRTLQGILPICMHCHKIRDDQQSWQQLERYLKERSHVEFSHGLCPECMQKHYPDIAGEDLAAGS